MAAMAAMAALMVEREIDGGPYGRAPTGPYGRAPTGPYGRAPKSPLPLLNSRACLRIRVYLLGGGAYGRAPKG